MKKIISTLTSKEVHPFLGPRYNLSPIEIPTPNFKFAFEKGFSFPHLSAHKKCIILETQQFWYQSTLKLAPRIIERSLVTNKTKSR